MNDRIRAVINAAEGFDAVIITDPVSRRYLVGFDTSDAGTLVILPDDARFIIDARYYEAVCDAVKDVSVILQDCLSEQLRELLGGLKKVAVETTVSVRELNSMRSMLDGYQVEPCEQICTAIAGMRSVKTESEVSSVILAQRIAEKAFDHILGFIKEGVTDIEIAAELEYVMRRNGAEGMSFDTIAVSGTHSSVPHGVPTEKRVEAGDFITMDFGAVKNGCHSDMTRTVAVGFATDEMRRVYDTVLSAQQAAIDYVKNGVKCSDADRAARDVITAAGYGEYFTHSTGHGVGYEIHEAPNLSPRSTQTLKTGNIVTVEPGIYIPSRFGVRIEDMVLVTDNGCTDLTDAPKHLIIV